MCLSLRFIFWANSRIADRPYFFTNASKWSSSTSGSRPERCILQFQGSVIERHNLLLSNLLEHAIHTTDVRAALANLASTNAKESRYRKRTFVHKGHPSLEPKLHEEFHSLPNKLTTAYEGKIALLNGKQTTKGKENVWKLLLMQQPNTIINNKIIRNIQETNKSFTFLHMNESTKHFQVYLQFWPKNALFDNSATMAIGKNSGCWNPLQHCQVHSG